MTRAQKRFIDFYVEQDFKNAGAAYRRAYPKCGAESARRNAHRLLTNADIQNYLAGTLAAIIKREKIPLEKRILDHWIRRAFFDPGEIINGKGALLRPLDELSKTGLSLCVDGIETRINAQGIETVRVKLADRDKALEMLQRYIQMIQPATQKIEIGGLSDEARSRLSALYDTGATGKINPADVDQRMEAPDDD